MKEFKDKHGNEYEDEPLLRLNQFYQALKEMPYSDWLETVEVIINGNGIRRYRQTIHNNGTEKENEILNVKGEYIIKRK